MLQSISFLWTHIFCVLYFLDDKSGKIVTHIDGWWVIQSKGVPGFSCFLTCQVWTMGRYVKKWRFPNVSRVRGSSQFQPDFVGSPSSINCKILSSTCRDMSDNSANKYWGISRALSVDAWCLIRPLLTVYSECCARARDFEEVETTLVAVISSFCEPATTRNGGEHVMGGGVANT